MAKKLFILLFSVLVVSCSSSNENISNPDQRFQVIYHQMTDLTSFYVIRDSVTSRKYLYVTSGYAGGLTDFND